MNAWLRRSSMNQIFIGDNLEIMRQMDDESVDLIYADPPYNSGRNYKDFDDRWDSREHYLDFMRIRLVEIHRLLKKSGTFYLHCDLSAVHYLKTELDNIFGSNNFRNQISWKRTSGGKSSSRNLPNNCDYILRYTKSNRFLWNLDHAYLPPDANYISRFDKDDNDGKGPYYLESFSYSNHSRPERFTYELLGVCKEWKWKKEDAEQAIRDGILVKNNNKIYKKSYLSESKGIQLDDCWIDIKPVRGGTKEYTGYKTQKPVMLLRRIINLSTNPEDLILDPFCGSGTTLVAARLLNRNYIGIDKNPRSKDVLEKRLDKELGFLR